MGSSTKRRQTMLKLERERKLREKRALKQEKKAEKKLAALNGGDVTESNLDGDESTLDAPVVADEPGF